MNSISILQAMIIVKMYNSILYMQNQNQIQQENAEISKISLKSNGSFSKSNINDIPIGGNNKKFDWSQYPNENDQGPAKPKKNVLKKKKQQQKPFSQQLPLLTNPEDRPLGNQKSLNFDQKPISKSNAFSISQFPEGEEQAPPATSTVLTLQQKLKSKAIKIRMSGFEQLLQIITHTNLEELPVERLQFDKLLKESNPGCLQKIVLSFQKWVEKKGQYGEQEIKGVIENGWIGGKGNTKKAAEELLDLFYQNKNIECENVIVSGLKGKILKTVAGYISTISWLLSIYGVKRMKYLKPYLPEVIKLISNEKLPAIKNQGIILLKEAMKWLGAQYMQPQFKTLNLKEGLKKQLDVFWESYDQSIVMTAPKNIEDEKDSKKKKGGKVDVYEISEAVDVFKKYNQKWVETLKGTEKWNQKTKLMQQFISACAVPKIANTDSKHIVDLIKRHIEDSNMNVVLSTLKIIGAIAQSLRKPFSPIIKQFLPIILIKFKDKKTQMIEQTNMCLDSSYHCLQIEDVIETVKEGLGDKNPNMKINILNWIGRYLEKREEERGELPQKCKEAIRGLLKCFENLLNDGASDVRDCMVKLMGKLKASSLGDNFFIQLESKMNKNLASKIAESKETTSAVKQKKVQEKKVVQEKKIEQKRPANNVNEYQKKQTMVETLTKSTASDDFEIPTFDECFQMLINNGVSEDDLKKIGSTNAKQRTAIMEIVVQQNMKLEYILKILRKLFKEWKQSNLNMNKELMVYLAQNVEKINKREFVVILPTFLQKLYDNKFQESIKILSKTFAERIPPKFLINQILNFLKPTDAKKPLPKLNGEVCSFLSDFIYDVSLNLVPFKELIEFAKMCFATPLSKKGAIQLLKTIYQYMGQPIKTCLDEATLKAVEGEFKKCEVLADKNPRVNFRDEALEQTKKQKIVNPLDTLPRADISNDVNRLMPKITDEKNWQNRKQGIQSLSSVISQNQNRIQITGLIQLFTVLKTKINDSNKSISKLFIGFTGQLVEAVGKEIKPHCRTFVFSIIEALSDKSELIRKQCLNSLNRIGTVVGFELVISCMNSVLQTEKSQRLEILNFIVSNPDGLLKNNDIKEFVKGVVNSLIDKNKQIRSLGEKMLEIMLQKISIDTFRTVAKDYKPAFVKDLTNTLDKYDKNKGNQNSDKKPVQKKDPVHSSLQVPGLSRTLTLSNLCQKQPELQKSSLQPSSLTPLFMNNEPFSNLKFLISFKQHRVNDRENTVLTNFNVLNQICLKEQGLLGQDLNKIFRKDLALKMMSFDYRNAYEVSVLIINMCRDAQNYNSIKEVYDVIIKWVYFRVFGGNTAEYSLVEVLPYLLVVLEKKLVMLNENEVIMVVAIFREFLCSSISQKPLELYVNTMKLLLKLNNPDRVLKIILKEYQIDMTKSHKHLENSANQNYKQNFLNFLVKTVMFEYLLNQEMLLEIAQIKEIAQDKEFIRIVYGKFNEKIMGDLNIRNTTTKKVSNINNPPPPVIQQPPPIQLNQINHPIQNSQQPQQYQQPPPAFFKNMPPINTIIPVSQYQSIPVQKTYPDQKSLNNSNLLNTSLNNSFSKQTQYNSPPQQSIVSRLTKLNYVYPHPSDLISQNLSKLYPPNDNSIMFFSQLLSQEKTLASVEKYSKLIVANIIKSTIQLLENRPAHHPDKLIQYLTLLQQALKNKLVIRSLNEVLELTTEFVLKQLVYEDENKISIAEDLKQRNVQFKAEQFIKVINSVMLRILENAHPQQLLVILLALLLKTFKRPDSGQKILSLIGKCATKIAGNYMNEEINQDYVKDFIKIGIIYFSELQGRLKPQDQGATIISNIITGVSKQIRQNIWNIYQKACKQANVPDQAISALLQSLDIPYPQKPNLIQQQLRKITELLSKRNTYDSGISLLTIFLSHNPHFQIDQYFHSLKYESKFISKVMMSLQMQYQDVIEDQSVGSNNMEDNRSRTRANQVAEQRNNQEIKQASSSTLMSEPMANSRHSDIRKKIQEMKAKAKQSSSN